MYTQEGRRKCLAADLRIITINTYIRNFSDYSNAKIQKFRYCAFYENETTLHPKDKRMKFDFINSNTRRIVSVFLLFFLYSLFNLSAMAQRVLSGSVRSVEDKSPLIGVRIQIEHTSIGTTTDDQGNYELKNIPTGKSTIVFSCVGLKKMTKTVFFSESERDKVLDVLMEDAYMQLNGVEVVGISERREIREVKQQGVPVTVIDGKTLAGRGTSISEVLNHQTGVKLRQTGGVGSQTKINVRGLEGNRVQIYIWMVIH